MRACTMCSLQTSVRNWEAAVLGGAAGGLQRHYLWRICLRHKALVSQELSGTAAREETILDMLCS